MQARKRLVPIARAALAVWACAAALNLRYHAAAPGLDQSGAFMFNYAHVHGLVFGRDLAFTYGPLSFLTLPMPLGRNLQQGFLFQLALWLVFAAAALYAVVIRRAPVAGAFLFALGLVVSSGVFREFGFAGPDMFLVYTGLLLLPLSLAAAGALCVLLFFIKFSSAATLGLAMVLFAAARPSRRALLTVAAVPPAILLVHVIFYGSPAWLWRYVRVAMEMSSGYGVTMGEGGDTRGLLAAVLILIVWAAGTAVLYWRRIGSFPLALACLGPLLLEFKHSFARESGHIEIFFLFVPLAAGLVALYTRAARRDVWYAAAPLAVVFALWYSREPHRVSALAHPLAPVANFRQLRGVPQLPPASEQLASERLPAGLLARVGQAPVAIFPMECTYAGANPINLRPFPILQAYQAYTPYLDGWNAAFLRDPRTAPEFILFDWDTIDDRHPLLDVPATALELYRLYDFDSAWAGHTLLYRRAQPRFDAMRCTAAGRAPLSEPLRFPPGSRPQAARIHLAWNFTGRVLKLLYRLPEVRIVASTSTGRVLNARVPPEVMEDGVPNFLPLDMAAARALFRSESAGRIDALSIGGPGARYLQPSAQVEICAADASLPPAPAVPDIAKLERRGSADTWRFEVLNDTGASAFSEITVPDTRGFVRVQGWALLDGAAAGGVVIELDGKPYPAEYGRPRPDIGALFHLGGAPACGFEWSVPVWNLGKTWHELSLKILAPGGAGYYDGGRKLRFKIE